MDQLSSKTIEKQKNNTNIYPFDLLTELADKQINGCLKLSYNSVDYFIYLYRGKIAYATNSLQPFERLQRHLRRLSHTVSTLNNEVNTSIRLAFETETNNFAEEPSDYQAIRWLVTQKNISSQQAVVLIDIIIKEVFETCLLLPPNTENNFIKKIQILEPIGIFDLSKIIKKCHKNLSKWYSVYPHLNSSYQRPYFFAKPDASREQQKIGKILRGFSFRQLSAILNQNELVIVKKFYPLIANKTIIIRDPQEPYNLLPQISSDTKVILEKLQQADIQDQAETEEKQEEINLDDIANKTTKQKQWKIVCIDDSPTILNEISRFLERDEFEVFPISQPLKALMKIIRIQPDLILLDVGMPNIDGYKLCSLIRKYSAFQNTPVVMVTGNKGLIDRAKARMAGATDYMTKPFTQSDLLNIVFRYLS